MLRLFNKPDAKEHVRPRAPVLIYEGDPIPERQKLALAIKAQRDRLKQMPDVWDKHGLKTAAMATFALGLLIMAVSFITNNGSTMPMFLLLQGVSLVCLSALLYFVSPSRPLSSEVCDAMALTNMQSISSLLSSLSIKTSGIYVPSGETGLIKVLFQTTRNKRGMTLMPPGHGLYQYVRSLGASFTEDGLDSEIKDIFKNSLELATDATARVHGDKVSVTIKGLANSGMCSSLRRNDAGLCCQIGCPICSLAGCIIVDALKRNARIAGVSLKDNNVNVIYELL